MGAEGIDNIFSYIDNHLVQIKNPFIGEKWYLFLGKPFIIEKNGQYYLRFFQETPAANCVYLWKNNHLTLTNKNGQICTGVP